MDVDSQSLNASLTRLTLTAKPWVGAMFSALETTTLNDVFREHHVNSVWTGQGGDHLFLQTSLPFGVCDYAALKGYRPGVLRSLRDSARVSKLSYWRTASVLWTKDLDLIERAFSRTPIAKNMFLTNEVRSVINPEYLRHPWMTEADSLPPGQRLQIASLCEVLNRHRPISERAVTYEHHPLLSQPLIELCLRIPSYVHLYGGIDRAVERAAFRDLIPVSIVTRRQKGHSSFFILTVIRRSREYLRELVLGGILTERHIVDRHAIEPYLDARRPIDGAHFWPFLSCIAAELWIQNSINCGVSV